MKKLLLLAVFTLFASLIYSQTIVSGNVTGVWEPGGNPYIVTGDVYVVDSLIIQAGVNVKFQAGGWKIEVGSGDRFLADGTNEEPIVFEPYQGNAPGLWDKIYINWSDDNDTLKYCKIIGALIGIHVYYSNTVISSCEIYGNNEGIIVQGQAFANIINCTISHNDIGIEAVFYWSWDQADAKITNSIVAGNYVNGIKNNSGGIIGTEDILYNCFWGNGENFYGITITPGFGSNGNYQNFNGDSCDIYFNIYNDPMFIDTANANFNLQPESKCIDAGTNLILGQFTYDPDGTMPDIGANYYPHSNAAILAYSFPEQTGPAEIDPVNKNITIEVYDGANIANLIADFNLAGGATATVNGVAQISGETPNDFTFPVTYVVTSYEGTNVQNWLVTVNVATGIEENIFQTFKVYPNPFASHTTISFENSDHQDYTLSLYDLSGKRILEIDKIKSPCVELEKGGLEAGVYILELRGENTFQKKLVVK